METVNIKNYLQLVDSIIESGEYKDDWASLSKYPVPKWFEDSKLGAFIHWGVFSVPAFFSEWYSRHMYQKDHPAYEHHIKTYGTHDKFGYKDFIPMFKAEKFDANAWVDAIKSAGMKYIVPVSEHHDHFKMYESRLSRWNSCEMGPKKDIMQQLSDACDNKDIIFGASNHRAENYWFMNTGMGYKSDISEREGKHYAEFYGPAAATPTPTDPHDKMILAPTQEWCEDWLATNCELVDKYRPKCVYFDWWIKQKAFNPYLKKFAAYYYNRSQEWGEGVTIFYKEHSFGYGTGIFDIERGGLSELSARPWQTCTAIAKNSWSYTQGNQFKTPQELAQMFVDIVSKNGCLLLNIGPKASGEICSEEIAVLKAFGDFMQKNGEAIYGSRPFSVYGEGKVNSSGKSFSEKAKKYTPKDFRFTTNNGNMYVFVFKASKNNKYAIKTFGGHRSIKPKNISILGYQNKVSFDQTEKALNICTGGPVPTDMPFCIKIEVL